MKFSATRLRKIILSKDQPPEELMRPAVFAAIKRIENPLPKHSIDLQKF